MSRSQTQTRIDAPHKVASKRGRVVVRKLNDCDVALIESTPTATDEASDEKCPVVRANQVFFAGEASGRLRVVFF